MKKYLYSVVSLLVLGTSFSQTSDLGLPEFIRGKYKKTKSYQEFAAVNITDQLALDEINRQDDLNKMLRFGFEHAADVDVMAAAEKTVLPNGDILYQYGLYCPAAISINVIFDRFELAAGSRLYLTAKNGESFAGAYTSINNNANKVLGTELVYDQYAVIEVIEPKEALGKSVLHLGTVVHGYRNLDNFMAKALGQSGSCNVDVNCPLGVGWENQRNAVTCVVSGGGACSGSLVNNTSGSIIPYYLSANHCGSSSVAGWVFRFRWERAAENTICATANSNANNGPTNMTVNGGVLRASNSSSDFILVELNTAPNPAWGIYYNGWDHSDALTVTQGTGIHHPSGDIKKISRENDPLTQQVTAFNGNPNTNVWRISNWDQGVTEPGSSGSPLFDQNHRTIGVLSGGSSACSGTVDNGGYDIYGRFGTAWDLGSTPATRLKDWLDPSNTGTVAIDGVNPLGVTPAVDGGLQNPQGVSGSICGETVAPQITITNAGTSALTSAVISYGFDGNNSQTYNWTGNLAQFQNDVITLPNQTLSNGNHTFSATITSANGTADAGVSNNTVSSTMNIVVNGKIIDLDLNLDRWGSEISWQVLNATNNALYSSAVYPDGPTAAIVPVHVEFCLAPGCYKFKIMDSQGDGMTSNTGMSGSYKITDASDTVLAEITEENANFGSADTKQFCLEGGSSDVINNDISLFPNPAENILNVTLSGSHVLISISVFNVTGQILMSGEATGQSLELNIGSLASGVYLFKIKTSASEVIRRVVVN